MTTERLFLSHDGVDLVADVTPTTPVTIATKIDDFDCRVENLQNGITEEPVKLTPAIVQAFRQRYLHGFQRYLRSLQPEDK